MSRKTTPWILLGWPKRVADFEGLQARTKRQFKSGRMKVPEGTLVTIGHCNRARDIHIEAQACEKCGISIYMTRLHYRDLELVK